MQIEEQQQYTRLPVARLPAVQGLRAPSPQMGINCNLQV